MPRPLQSWRYNPGERRDLRLDFLRGYAMFAIAVNHLGQGSWFRPITGGGSFLVSAAEGFLCISGLTLGLISARMPLDGAIARLWRRTWTVYLATLGITFGFGALALVTGSHVWGGLEFAGRVEPLRWAGEALLLLRAYGHADILVAYVVYLALAPLVVHALARGRTAACVAGLGLLYLATLFAPEATTLPFASFRSPLGNAPLFYGGMLLGWHLEPLAKWWTGVRLRPWIDASTLLSAVLLLQLYATGYSFLEVPPDLAPRLQGDSVFPEVLANNAAIRRARGRFIGRIDQDSLVGADFLATFLELADGVRPSDFDLERSFLFVGRRSIPRSIALRCPPLGELETLLTRYGPSLPREGRGRSPWYDAPVGVLVLSRSLWHEVRGYDERLLYWGFMETDLAGRVARKHQVVDLERTVGCDIHHLRHSKHRIRITKRRKNPRRAPHDFAPNGQSWGLVEHSLDLHAGRAISAATSSNGHRPGSSPGAGLAVARERILETCLGVGRRAVAPFR